MRTKKILSPLLILTLQTAASFGQRGEMIERDVDIGKGISLHVVEQGEGEPLVFIHGVTNSYLTYQRQVSAFASRGYRAICYSRRYNHPNNNAPQPNHSAIVEAEDLGRLLTALKIKKAHLMGHSYGAYTALMFALKYPERIATVTLAEPPLVPWIASIKGENAEAAKAHRDDHLARFVGRVRAAFDEGDEEKVLRAFFDYFVGEGAVDRLPQRVVEGRRRNLKELKALVSSKDMFPIVKHEDVSKLKVPVLILSGARTHGIAKYTDDELERLLPKATSRRVTFENATHMMWLEEPVRSRNTVLQFIREMGGE